ncbi:MAG: hypothetical protein SFV15_22120 [Polyangiaceae bacterium]|nr:hypothetical protein [Polyangiaceae bacterium]
MFIGVPVLVVEGIGLGIDGTGVDVVALADEVVVIVGLGEAVSVPDGNALGGPSPAPAEALLASEQATPISAATERGTPRRTIDEPRAHSKLRISSPSRWRGAQRVLVDGWLGMVRPWNRIRKHS